MKLENITNAQDIESYIVVCLNDYELEITTKEETIVFLLEMVFESIKKFKVNE